MTPLTPYRGAPPPVATHLGSFYFKVDPMLKDRFQQACLARGRFASDVLRGLMQQYVEESNEGE